VEQALEFNVRKRETKRYYIFSFINQSFVNSKLFIVNLRLINCKNTIMAIKSPVKKYGLSDSECNKEAAVANSSKKGKRLSEFSPAWVVINAKNASGYQMELIERIRAGVRKDEWKQLILAISATEKEFEHILPTSISSMQKKNIYSKETSERIYELARLFGLGYEVFDSKEDFKEWLMTPSRAMGNKKPFDMLDSSFGFEMVKNEIIRIQYNVYS
jgi:putative toxin-antitoxin system antitoxin component (TIGR02293 family)